MSAIRKIDRFISKKAFKNGWYSFIVVFFVFIVITPTVYVLSYAVTNQGDVQNYVLSKTKSITIKWTAYSGSDFKEYGLYMSSENAFSPNSSNLVKTITPRTTASYTLSGIKENAECYFRVIVYTNNATARNISFSSNDILAPWGGALYAPAPARNLTVSAYNNTTGEATLNWAANTDVAFQRYEVYASPAGNISASNVTYLLAQNANTYTAANLSANTTYCFWLRVVGAGGLSADSNRAVLSWGAFNASYTAYAWVSSSATLDMMPLVMNAVWFSIAVALIVVLIDFVAGFPLAWLLARRQFKGKRYLDTLIDLPVAVPTAALGFSIAIFWAAIPPSQGLLIPFGALSIISSPFWIVVLLHIAFSYPYMVRTLAAAIEEIDVTYETAAGTLGASPLTVSRTITMPLFKAGLSTGVALCAARSLSETGATIIAISMVAPLSIDALISTNNVTGPALLGTIKNSNFLHLEPVLALISTILIIASISLLIASKLIIMRAKLPTKKVWPRGEKFLSTGLVPKIKNYGALLFFGLIVIVPSFFIFSYVIIAKGGNVDWWLFQYSLITSIVVASIVTLVNLALAIPMGIYIARCKNRKIAGAIDTLVDIPIIVPTVALGFSLGLFWRQPVFSAISVDIVLIILAHIAFTYPFIVRTVTSAMESTDEGFEDTSRTLGAGPLQTFRKVTLPMIKPSILAGAIMAFTRSLDETGATLAVISKDSTTTTAPVYIVDLITKKSAYYPAALACIVLIGVSFVSLILLRYINAKAR